MLANAGAYHHPIVADERQSRRDLGAGMEMETNHTRSKSADYLTDPRRPREEQPIIPENDLQKSLAGTGNGGIGAAPLLGEHELRFRKSTERMHVPDWYRDYGPGQLTAAAAGPPSATTTSGVFSMAGGPSAAPYYGHQHHPVELIGDSGTAALTSSYRPWTYLSPPATAATTAAPGAISPPVGGISFPPGMFDKYKDEIEDMRRSRSSLHQLGLITPQQQEHTKAFSKTEVNTLPAEQQQQHQPGYTVSTVPTEWKLTPKDRKHSRVVEVADTFVERPFTVTTDGGDMTRLSGRYGGRVTLEEVLDALFQAIPPPVPEPAPADPSVSEQRPALRNANGPGIFTPNQALMDRLAEQPHLAEQLLKNEPMFVRCAQCQLVRALPEARAHFCWCRHCYTYYCCRSCRQRDWERHRDRCSFARINSLCKEVIMKVRRDPETQFNMSKVAREGYRREGRGSVNIRLISAYSALLYLDQGWRVFAQHDPNQLLFYYPIQALIEQRKEPSLIQLCQKYNPNEKFILSVSIIADIEQCPETPPPVEPRSPGSESGADGAGNQQMAAETTAATARTTPTAAATGVPPTTYGTAVPTNV